jgi:hypothetical protein
MNGDPSSPVNGLHISGPAGLRLTATGPLVIIILIMIAGFGSLGYLLHRGFDVIADDSRHRMAEHTAILGAQNDLACILAMEQSARPAAILDPKGICHYARMLYRTTPDRTR